MSYPNDLDSVKALFASHGAQIYWNNWAETKLWYWSCMMPEMLRAQNDVLKQSKEKSKRGRKKKKRRKKKRTEEVWNRGMEVDVQDGGNCRESAIEQMSAEYLEFHEQTLKHREDLKKQKELLREKEIVIEYIADDQGPEEKPTPSTAPPDSRPGIARMKEMETMYGSSATKIHMIETRMQAKFDELRTRKQPKLWPVIPLNL